MCFSQCSAIVKKRVLLVLSVTNVFILSWASVTEMLDLFLLTSLCLSSTSSYFSFMVIQYFTFLKGVGEITQRLRVSITFLESLEFPSQHPL